MTAGKIALIATLAAILGIGSAIFGRQWLDDEQGLTPPPPRATDNDSLDRLPELSLPNTDGEEIASSHWAGKVLVLNFWATWCPPCLREIPLFDELQQTHDGDGLQIVGIAIDNPESVEQFLFEHPVSFPILIGDGNTAEMSRRLGNRLQGLPFTVIFDHQGKRAYAATGEMTRASLLEHLNPLLLEVHKSRIPSN